MIGSFLSWILQKFPAKGTEILQKLNARLKTTFTSVSELPDAITQMAKNNPATTGVVLSTLGSVMGIEVVSALLSEYEGKGNNTYELNLAQSSILELVAKNSGDQDAGTTWGHDTAEVKTATIELTEAFRMIQNVGAMVGGHKPLKQLFIALHSLELAHFDLYEEQYKLFNGR